MEAQADYYDSLAHAAAVVGLNTSAFLEAAILGKPVLTLLAEEFRENQEGTLHFHYLLGDNGLLTVARDWTTHVRQVAAAVAAPEAGAARSRAFAARFLRPRGSAVPATAHWVTAVETLAAQSAPLLGSEEAPTRAARLTLSGLEAVTSLPMAGSLLRDPRETAEARERRRHLRRHRSGKRRLRYQQDWQQLKLFVASRTYRQDKLSRLLRGPRV